MKRLVIYVAVLAALFFVPVERADIGKLHPVEVVHIYKEGENVVIETDSQDVGIGETLEEAFADLKETTPGVIYLDTAEYLLISPDVEDALPDLRGILSDDVQLCYAENKVDLKEAACFLPVHGRLPQLKAWEEGVELPYLTCFSKRLKMSKKGLDN